MPRAIWTGSIGFGIAHIPVKLYSATSERDIKFRRWDPETETYPRQTYMVQAEGQEEHEVRLNNLSRVYEITRDVRVEVTDEDLSKIRPASRRHMQVLDFVPLDTVSPIFYEKAYFLGPGGGGSEMAYTLFAAAIAAEGVGAVVRVLMRTKEHLALIYMNDGILLLSTMHYEDEIASGNATHYEQQAVTPAEVEVARELVRASVEPFVPWKYADNYRATVLDMIYDKGAGFEREDRSEELPTPPTGDIITLLRSQIAERQAA